MSIRPVLRDLVPPLLKRPLQRVMQKYGWFGDYPSWEAAAVKCSGYQSDMVLARVRDAALQVKQGLARYERDSVLFPEIQYSWPLLSALMHVAAINHGVLRVLDFGGSLGSMYYQHRAFFQGLREVRWGVVEQEHFVRCGKKYFEDECLKFYDSIDGCLASENPDIILFSSVLQYLPSPCEVLAEVFRSNIAYVLIDRTGFSLDGREHITVQKVDPTMYPASYPCHFFAKPEFCGLFGQHYELIAEFPASDKSVYPAEFLGF